MSTVSLTPSRAGRRLTRTDVAQALVTLAIAGVVGLVGLSQRVPPRMLLFVVPVVCASILVLRHPKWCVVGVLAGAVFGTYRSGLDLGAFTVRPADVFLVILAGWAVHLRIREGRSPTSRVGQLQIALLLLTFGISLLTTVGNPTGVISPLTSWMRLACTFALVWLVPYALRQREDGVFVLRTLALLIALELFGAVFLQGRDGGRLAGVNGSDVEGLVAVVLLVLVVNLPLFATSIRILLGLLALVAVVQSKSIGSVAALAAVLGVYGLRAAAVRSPRAESLVRPARVVMLLIGAFYLVTTLRPHDVPQSGSFNASSAAVRVSVGYAGLEVFARHPVLGVGWQRSTSELGSEAVVTAVRRRFPHFRTDLLTVGRNTLTVHNAYVQVLAESGLVGFVILATGLVVGSRNIRTLISRAGADADVARTLMVCLVVILIWWNDNPLFGSQPETVLFAVLLGLLAAIRVGPPASEPRPRAAEPVSVEAGPAPERA